MENKEILSRAADLLEEYGWGHGGSDSTIFGTSKRMCVTMALHRAANDLCPCIVLENFLGLREMGIVTWNDAPGRTQEEVVSVLRSAAEAQCKKP